MLGPRLSLHAGVLAVLVAVPFAVGAATDEPTPREVFRFADPEVVESSGLAVVDGLVVTTNDSGDSGRVFVVDPGSGETVGVTSWDEEPVDVEALAPAGDGEVWVGDIGDNTSSRDDVSVLRVPVGRGDREVTPESYTLVYPDGSHDAETLLRDPLTGRLLVVTKGVFGGTVYAAPVRLRADRANRLTAVGSAPAIVTDGAFLPGGGAVVLRSYSHATVLAVPAWQDVASWRLPAQRQAEGLAVDGGRLLLSTEGVRTAVLAEPVPEAARSADSASPAWTLLRWVAVARGMPGVLG